VSLLVKIVVVEDIVEDHELAIICKIYFHTMVCCQSLQRGKEMAGGQFSPDGCDGRQRCVVLCASF
jgi:hypothetical protein